MAAPAAAVPGGRRSHALTESPEQTAGDGRGRERPPVGREGRRPERGPELVRQQAPQGAGERLRVAGWHQRASTPSWRSSRAAAVSAVTTGRPQASASWTFVGTTRRRLV